VVIVVKKELKEGTIEEKRSAEGIESEERYELDRVPLEWL
jgi:hypothetical protein